MTVDVGYNILQGKSPIEVKAIVNGKDSNDSPKIRIIRVGQLTHAFFYDIDTAVVQRLMKVDNTEQFTVVSQDTLDLARKRVADGLGVQGWSDTTEANIGSNRFNSVEKQNSIAKNIDGFQKMVQDAIKELEELQSTGEPVDEETLHDIITPTLNNAASSADGRHFLMNTGTTDIGDDAYVSGEILWQKQFVEPHPNLDIDVALTVLWDINEKMYDYELAARKRARVIQGVRDGSISADSEEAIEGQTVKGRLDHLKSYKMVNGGNKKTLVLRPLIMFNEITEKDRQIKEGDIITLTHGKLGKCDFVVLASAIFKNMVAVYKGSIVIHDQKDAWFPRKLSAMVQQFADDYIIPPASTSDDTSANKHSIHIADVDADKALSGKEKEKIAIGSIDFEEDDNETVEESLNESLEESYSKYNCYSDEEMFVLKMFVGDI